MENLLLTKKISIHPPRVGRDRPPGRRTLTIRNFNPPSPCGEGLMILLKVGRAKEFQSTLPVWGGTGGGKPWGTGG